MAILVDTCRSFEVGLLITIIVLLQTLSIHWVIPAKFCFTAGWELRLHRIIAAFCLTVFGLIRLFYFMYRTPSLPEVFFGINDCPPQRAELFSSVTWTVVLQIYSVFLWSPLSWLSRRLSTGSASVLVKCIKLACLLPVQWMRAVLYSFTAIIVGMLWLCTSILAPPANLLLPPFAIFTSLLTIRVLFLYFVTDETNLPPWSRVALHETADLLRVSFSARHALQVAGRALAHYGYFGCRDRWFRRDALQAGLRDAVIATLPGLIGPIAVDQHDISDAVSAIRGLSNKWSDIAEKESLLDDKNTLVYSLSYKHMPVWEGGKMIRLSEQRATKILEMVLSGAREHGYGQVMLWCDGASAAGLQVNHSWEDIGLLPYALYRTMRIETDVDGERLTENRLWLELEKGLSELTCGMDVVVEGLHEGRMLWERSGVVKGKGHKPMAAVLRMSAWLTQGVYAECEVSQEEDRTKMRAWARRLLRRSGIWEMNKGLGWSGQPAADTRAKAVLIRITTLRTTLRSTMLRRRIPYKEDEGQVTWAGFGSRASREKVGITRGRTEFWLDLLGFENDEIEALENESLECFTVQFEEEATGRWEMEVANLQGNYFVNMVALRSLDWKDLGEEEGWWLLTNSQVKKTSRNVKKWLRMIVEEVFSVRKKKCKVKNIEHDCEEIQGEDSWQDWLMELIRLFTSWRADIMKRRNAKMANGTEHERCPQLFT